MPADGRWDLTRRLTFNPYAANVENMVSSKEGQQMADGIKFGI